MSVLYVTGAKTWTTKSSHLNCHHKYDNKMNAVINLVQFNNELAQKSHTESKRLFGTQSFAS